MHQLDAVVGAMRGIAATRAQQSRGLLAGHSDLCRSIAQAIAQALRLLPPRWHCAAASRGRAALILFAAEQGFVGAFGERMLRCGAAHLPRAPQLFLIGSRGARAGGGTRLRSMWQTAMAAHVGSVQLSPAARRRAVSVAAGRRQIAAVAVVFPVWTPGDGLVVSSRSLLPLDQRRFARVADCADAPLITLPPALLLERLAEEYVYASLCEAAMQAFAAENEARAAAMVRARSNVETIAG